METPDNFNFTIVGIQQDAPLVYSISVSTYTNIGYRLVTDYSGYHALGTVTYNGQKYFGIELSVVQDSTAELPHSVQEWYMVANNEPDLVGVYVKLGTQIETINF